MGTPPNLYRKVDSCEAAVNHREGILWFKSLQSFWKIGGVRQDKSEGRASYRYRQNVYADVSDERLIFPVFVLCFSEIYLPEKFGEYGVKLSNPSALRDKVADQFCKETRVQWGKVEYNKTYEVSDHPQTRDYEKRKYFSKPSCFAYEREWRLAIFMRPPLRLLNENLKLKLGAIPHLFEISNLPKCKRN